MEEKEVQKVKTSGIKVTPLNIITAMSLVAAGFLMFKGFDDKLYKNFNGLYLALCVFAALASFVCDLIFRKLVPLLRNLWIVQISFLVLTVVMILILKIIIF
jgi:hypothetical protein